MHVRIAPLTFAADVAAVPMHPASEDIDSRFSTVFDLVLLGLATGLQLPAPLGEHCQSRDMSHSQPHAASGRRPRNMLEVFLQSYRSEYFHPILTYSHSEH